MGQCCVCFMECVDRVLIGFVECCCGVGLFVGVGCLVECGEVCDFVGLFECVDHCVYVQYVVALVLVGVEEVGVVEVLGYCFECLCVVVGDFCVDVHVEVCEFFLKEWY